MVLNQEITKAQIDANLLTFVPDANENGALYASFDFYVNEGRSTINVLAGEPNPYTLNGGSLAPTDQILANASNFGLGGTYSSSISVGAANATIDAAYLAQGSVLFDGFVPDGGYTAGELAAINTWVNGGGILIATSDNASYDDVSNYYGLTIGGTGNATWNVADQSHEIMNGPFGLVGNNGDPLSASGAISYFDSASLTVGDVVLANDSVSGEPTVVLRAQGSGWILFTSDEGIFRTNMTGGGTIATANDRLAANIFAWAAEQAVPTESHTMNIDVTPVNDVPVESSIEGADIDYDENDGQVQITNTISISDIDDADIESAVVQITGGYIDGEDVLSFINTGTISGAWDTGSGTLTLTGGDSLADYEVALRSVQYENISDDPSNSTRTVSFTVHDGDDDSNTQTRDINVAPLNDAPVITGGPAASSLNETNSGLADAGSLIVSDADRADVVTAAVDTVAVTGSGSSSVPVSLTNTILRNFLTVTPTAILDGTETTATLTWNFSSGSEAFDFLANGETLILTYTVSVTDDAGTPLNDTETVSVTITGTNDTPTVTVVDVIGAVTEDASTPNLTDNGSVTFAELDETDVLNSSVAMSSTATTGPAVPAGLSTALSSAMSLTQTGTNDGTIAWSFTVANSLTQYLADGETVTVVYTITVADDSGTGTDTTTQDVTVVITGTNDVPTITVVDVLGAVTEDASTPNLADSGSVTFAEVDDTDLLNSSVVISNTATTGPAIPAGLMTSLNSALSLTQTGTNDGSIAWDFNVANSLTQYLADGETVTVTYTIAVADDSGTGNDTATQDVTVVITGTNDVPTITVVDVVGAVTEDASTPNLTDSGSVTFTEVDDTDLLNSSVAIGSTATTGPAIPAGLTAALNSALSLTQTGTNDGSIAWDFTVANSLTQYLADGETVTAIYTVTITDDSGSGNNTTTQDITVVITGTNDVPTIAVVDVGGAVTEDATTPNLSDNGSVTFSEVDETDVLNSSVAITSTATTGPAIPAGLTTALNTALSLTQTGTNDGSIAWDFSVANGLTQYLADGETVTVVYTITVADDSGAGNGTATQDVTVVITGTNDVPIITVVDVVGTVAEDASTPNLTDSGSVTFAEVDDTDLLNSSVSLTGAATTGPAIPGGLTTALNTALSLTQTGTNDGTVAWDFSVANSLTQYLADGETITVTYTITVTDDSGTGNNTATQDVTITITGTNDAPIISGGPDASSLAETDTGLSDTGALTVSDVDTTDVVSAAVDSVVVSGTGSGNVPPSLDNATLLGFLTAAPIAILDGTENSASLTWDFDSGTQAFDFLATGETLVLTYTVSVIDDDGVPLNDTETVAITITGTNDGPQATNLNAMETYTEDTLLNLTDIVANDIDDGSLTVTLTLSDVAAGTLSTGTSGAVTSTFVGGVWTASGTTADVNALLAALTFSPAANYDLDFTIATSVDDGEAPVVTGVKNFTAIPVNDEPEGTDNTVTTLEDVEYAFSRADFGFSDPVESDSFNAVQITNLPSAGALYLDADLDGVIDGGEAVTAGTYISIADIDAGRLKFKSDLNAFGTGYANFDFQVQDDGGTANSGNDTDQSPNTITIDVTEAFRIEGNVLEDVNGDSSLADAVGVDGVTVSLYQDSDGTAGISAGDVLLTSVATSGGGFYSFVGLTDDTYFVVVDSQSITPSVAFSGSPWAEQTYGVAGALAADGVGGTNVLGSAGAAFGGRLGDASDDASNLLSAEHVTIISSVAGSDVANVDSAFSFNVVTNVEDSGQGSFRQFVSNANEMTGANAMRFVPTVASNQTGAFGDWWSVELTSNLALLTDGGTTIDGVAYDLTDGVTVLDTNTGTVNTSRTVGVDGLTLDAVSRQEFEINFGTNTDGIQIDFGGITVRNTALFGAERVGATTGAQIHVTENVLAVDGGATITGNLLGTRADGSDPGALRGSTAMLINGAANVTNNYMAFLNQSGVRFNGLSLGNTDGSTFENNEIHSVAYSHTAGDGITVDSQGNTIQGNYIHDLQIAASVYPYNGKGIELWYDANNNLIANNTIEGAITAGIGLGADTTDNLITKNVITGTTGFGGAGGAGILVTSSLGTGNPTGNTISQNETYGNAGLGIDIDNSGGSTTAYGDGVDANDGVLTPGSTNEAMDHPIISISNLVGTNLTLSGFIGTAPGQTAFAGARIEFFQSSVDASGYGEGRRYLGFLMADANGNFSGSLAVSGITDADEITATATSVNGSTSEFGPNNGVNVSPTDLNPNSININENTDTTGGVSAGVLTTTDADSVDPSESFTYSILAGGDAAFVTIGGASGDELILDDGFLDFETKSVYNITVRVTDSGGFTYDEAVAINVVDLNETPTFVASTLAINEGETVILTSANINTDDQDGDAVSIIVTNVSAGQFEFVVVPGVEILSFTQAQVDAGQVAFVHDGNEVAPAFDLTASDGLLSTTQSATINFTNVNDRPTDILPDSVLIVENTDTTGGNVVGTLSTVDTDAGDTFTYSIVGGADQGRFNIVGDQLIFEDGNLDFERQSTYSVLVRVTDSGGLTFDDLVAIDVGNINEAPISSTNTGASVDEGNSIVVTQAMLEITDPEEGPTNLTFTVTGMPANGTLMNGGVLVGAGGTFTQDDINSGRIVYTHDGSETSNDGFDFEVADGQGNSLLSQRFAITVDDVNDAPVATIDSFSVNEDGFLAGDVIVNDTDAENDSLTATLINSPMHAVSFNLSTDGSFSYTPALNYFGTDVFEYQVSDGNGGLDNATVTITVISVNDVPVGAADQYASTAGTTLTSIASILNNDTDVEADGLVAILVAGPSNGALSLSASGQFVYTPDNGFAGADSFTYVPNDGAGSGAATLVEIQIVGSVPPSVGSPDPGTPNPEPEILPEDTDPTEELPTEPEEEDEESESPELIGASSVRKFVPIVNLSNDPNFEGEGNLDDLVALMADSGNAKAILKTILSSVSLDDIGEGIDADDIRRLRLSSSASAVFNPAYLWEQFDEIADANGLSDFSITVGAITAFGTIGYVFWALRGGALMALALSQLPSWRMIDPLPVLESYTAEQGNPDDDMDQFFN